MADQFTPMPGWDDDANVVRLPTQEIAGRGPAYQQPAQRVMGGGNAPAPAFTPAWRNPNAPAVSIAPPQPAHVEAPGTATNYLGQPVTPLAGGLRNYVNLPGGNPVATDGAARLAKDMQLGDEQERKWREMAGLGHGPRVPAKNFVERGEEPKQGPELGAPYRPASVASPGGGASGGMAAGGGGAGGAGLGGGATRSKEETVTQRQLGNPVSLEERAARDDAMASRELAASSQYEADTAAGEAQGRAATQKAAAEREYMANERAAQQRDQDRMAAEDRKYSRLQDEARTGTIDPNRYWKNQTTGSAIAAIIGGMLAGAASAINHTPNMFAASIEKAIDRDIDAQKEDLAGKRRAASDQGQLLDRLRQQLGDDARARLALKGMTFATIDTQLAQEMAGLKDKEALAKYQAARAQIGEAQAEIKKQYDARTQDHVTVTEHETASYGGGGGAGAGGAGDGLTSKEQTDTNDLSKELVRSGVPEQRAALDRLTKLIPPKGDIPGVGGVHGLASMAGGRAERADDIAYNLVGSKQGQEIRQAAAVLFNKQLKDESGAAVSDQELERHKAAFYGARDADSARRALSAYGSRLGQLEATIRSGHDTNVNRVQQQRQGAYSSALGADRSTTVTPVTPIR